MNDIKKIRLYNIKKIFVNIFLILYIVYNLQGSLYPSGSTISQFVLAGMFFIGGIYFVKCLLLSRKEYFLYIWTVMFIINIIHFLISLYTDNIIDKVDVLKNVIGCSIGFYPFYYLHRKGHELDCTFFYFSIALLFTCILSFYYNRQNYLLNIYVSDESQVVNNVAYAFVGLIPFLFFMKKKLYLNLGVFFLILFFIIQGAKRGAVIIGVIGGVIYLYYLLKEKKGYNIFQYVFVFIIIITVIYFTYELFQKNEYLLLRMSAMIEGDSSGRDSIYTDILNSWLNSDSLINILFGYGFIASTTFTGGLYAHNDWLEILVDYGLLGTLIYFSLFIKAVKMSFSKNLINRDQMIMITICIIWLMSSSFSMWYFSLNTFTQSILLGYFFGSKKQICR